MQKDLLKEVLSSGMKTEQHVWNTGETTETHEFLLFLKPELTSPHVDLQKILDLFFSITRQHGVSLRECMVYPTQVIKEKQFMERNYSTLNQIARCGIENCSLDAIQKLKKLSPKGLILGGYQFLELYPFFTPKALSILINNVNVVKLEYGTYASVISLFDQPVTVLNGFHPHQLASLTANNAYIVAFRCGSSQPWKSIRSHFVGMINPEIAHSDSLRHQFWKHRKSCCIQNFSTAYNGVHVSAGPLEVMHQYSLFFNTSPSVTLFWKSASSLLSREQLLALSPETRIKSHLLYHLTEDLDMSETLELLRDS